MVGITSALGAAEFDAKLLQGRTKAALAYDSARGRIVLFGGAGPGANLSDTWEWDGQRWSLRAPAVSPPARQGHANGV